MNCKPTSRAELKLAIEKTTADLNKLLQVANELLIPVAIKPNNTNPKSESDFSTTKQVLTVIYPALI